MGWLYRKSVSAGPFRINFSKKGTSYSMGVKGARINTGPRGTYVSLNAHGISYRQKIPAAGSRSPIYEIPPDNIHNNITSAAVEELTDTDSQAFIAEINQKCAQISYVKGVTWPLLLMLAWALFISFGQRERIVQAATDTTFLKITALNDINVRKEPNVKSKVLQMAGYDETYPLLDASNPQWFKIRLSDTVGYIKRELAEAVHLHTDEVKEQELYLVNEYLGYEIVLYFLCVIPLVYWLKKLDRKRFAMELHYDMDDKYKHVYEHFNAHFVAFTRCSRIWQYLNAQSTTDFKRNAGASKVIKRVRVKGLSGNKMPLPHFVTNVTIPWISLHNMELYFLPERLLIKRGNTFAAVFYKNLQITGTASAFVESEMLPPDARVLEYTWQYVNKNGGPDRRFHDNRRFPICAYSEYTFRSGTGIFEVIATSRPSAMDNFASFIRRIGELQTWMEGSYQ